MMVWIKQLKHINYLVIIFFSLNLQSCSTPPSNHSSSTDPTWVTETITLAKQNPHSVPITITQYRYQDQTVYYLSPIVVDGFSQIFDKNRRLLCSPEGGLTGKGDGQCTNFFQQAENKVILFKKPPQKY